ncbi:hypothetical protein [Pseudarthrobacter sp. C4D7]|uniref:hypothetical protein n=1 Tax=Pseudarthrobacter sp. C4D7 TaxID=2735268 RepID=UPI0015856672|nr:hypothetical protein [Pseudarthrobacter sp. C4D7]NUT71870.1 hypothetical protein [Pseudarthrobacter sp. C4D7]
MEQQDNSRAGSTGHDGRVDPSAAGREQKDGPAPVWEGQGGSAEQEPVAGGQAPRGQSPWERNPQGQPAQGGGAPTPGSPSPGWGTTSAPGQVPGPGTGWGAPQQYAPGTPPRAGKGNWTAKKSALVGGVAVVVAAAAGAGAYAAGNGAAAANNAQGMDAAGQFGPGSQGGVTGPNGQSGVDGRGSAGGMGMDGGPGGLGMGSAGLNAAVHSEYVVLDGSNYVTMAGQAGTVTEISDTSMTVKSEDGFTRTYQVASDVQVIQMGEGMRQRGGNSAGGTTGMSSVATGASVRVTALKNSDTYVAETIQLAAAATATTPGAGTSSN